jgi:hypothetical protein
LLHVLRQIQRLQLAGCIFMTCTNMPFGVVVTPWIWASTCCSSMCAVSRRLYSLTRAFRLPTSCHTPASAVTRCLLQPFFALSAAELNTALPLLTEVSPEILKVVFPLLAQQPEGTMDKMLKFLSLVSGSRECGGSSSRI